MQIPDDERFEAYLKQFRPLTPDPLPLEGIATKRQSHFSYATWAVGILATMAIFVISFRILHNRVSRQADHGVFVQAQAPAWPMTIRDANALLATTPSYKSAMDELTLPQSSALPQNKQSALAVLAKEKITL